MEWRTRWHITIRWDRAENSPLQAAFVTLIVDTPAQLRYLVERARADPHVTSFPYQAKRELVGDEPAACYAGHDYSGGSATRSARSWWTCCCGGHLVLHCWCGDVQVEPPVGADCDTREPLVET